MDVSIVVACHMQEQQVVDAYWSAVNQDFGGEFDVLICHDGCQTGQSAGLSALRNRAIDKAKGEYIIVLDASDRLPSNYLTALYGVLIPNSLSFSGCPVQFIGGLGWELARFGSIDEGTYRLDAFRSFCPVPAAAMFPKRAWKEVKGYDETQALLEDWDFWYKLLSLGCPYTHTNRACLLRSSDAHSRIHRAPQGSRVEALVHMNEKYKLNLVLPFIVR